MVEAMRYIRAVRVDGVRAVVMEIMQVVCGALVVVAHVLTLGANTVSHIYLPTFD